MPLSPEFVKEMFGMVKFNGQEITKEQFREIMTKARERQRKIDKMAETEIGRNILDRKGIKY